MNREKALSDQHVRRQREERKLGIEEEKKQPEERKQQELPSGGGGVYVEAIKEEIDDSDESDEDCLPIPGEDPIQRNDIVNTGRDYAFLLGDATK